MLTQIKSYTKDISLFIFKDILFVYSHISKNLYGFKGFDAALFLLIDEKKDFKLIKEFYVSNEVTINHKYEIFINQINKILNGEDKKKYIFFKKRNIFRKLNLKNSKIMITNQKIYNLNSWYFALNDKYNLRKELNIINHLKAKNKTLTKIDSIIINKSLDIVFNEEIIKNRINKKNYFIPYFYSFLKEKYLEKIDFLITLHAASFRFKKKTLIMPASSGFGKSILSLYLIKNNFKIFSDDLTIIDNKGYLIPLPLGISIKESGWKVVESYFPKIHSINYYIRYDKQKVKYIFIKKFEKRRINSLGSIVIFPTFKQGSKTKLEKVGILEALNKIKNTQYFFPKLKDERYIKKWLLLLSSYSFYSLTYSSLSDAKNSIIKIISEDSNEKV